LPATFWIEGLKMAGTLRIAGALSLSLLAASPAYAVRLTFVANNGVDSGDCSSPAAPCATLQFAHGQTDAGGELKILNPGNYLSFTISKGIAITGVPGASVIRAVAGNAITINVPSSTFQKDFVSITGLEIDGRFGAGTFGVAVQQVGQLTIKNCYIHNFSSFGVLMDVTRNVKFLIEDTLVSNNGTEAIRVRASGLSATGALSRVASVHNGFAGLRVLAGAKVHIADSVFSGNFSAGILAGSSASGDVGGDLSVTRSSFQGSTSGIRVLAGSNLRIDNSSLTDNTIGLNLETSVVAKSAGNNFIAGNTTDVQGPGTIDTTNGQR